MSIQNASEVAHARLPQGDSGGVRESLEVHYEFSTCPYQNPIASCTGWWCQPL